MTLRPLCCFRQRAKVAQWCQRSWILIGGLTQLSNRFRKQTPFLLTSPVCAQVWRPFCKFRKHPIHQGKKAEVRKRAEAPFLFPVSWKLWSADSSFRTDDFRVQLGRSPEKQINSRTSLIKTLFILYTIFWKVLFCSGSFIVLQHCTCLLHCRKTLCQTVVCSPNPEQNKAEIFMLCNPSSCKRLERKDKPILCSSVWLWNRS